MSDDLLKRLSEALEDRYSIERELGEGGMATVFLAEDRKHHRKVALKVLKPELAAVVGGERFLGEIETTAGLQHPNILPLFDSGTADGFLYYVMPYVEGESLRELLERERQLPVADAVRIASEVAEALDYAHQHGVVHRDIKPANIMIQAGRPVVGDFGIAIALHQAGGSRMTETGLSLGTPHYMSPEQASGDLEVDTRTDVYSLGCTLYEMLVGRPPHTGAGPQAVLASILTKEPPPMASFRASVPRNVEGAVRCAIERLPADRFRTAGAFAAALADPSFRYGDEVGAASNMGPWRKVSAALAVALVVAVGWIAFGAREVADPDGVSRQRVVLSTIVGGMRLDRAFAIAPDGSAIAFVDTVGGARRLWVKEDGDATPRVLEGTEGAQAPEFSPDGTRIAFVSGRRLLTLSRSGGTISQIADSVVTEQAAIAWGDDGMITYNSGLWELARVPEAGGAEPTILWPERDSLGVAYVVAIEPLVGHRGVLFTRCGDGCPEVSVHLFDFETGEATLVQRGATHGWHTRSGHIVLTDRDGTLSAAPFDVRDGLLGTPVSLLSGVRTDRYHPDVQIGEDGTLLYALGQTSLNRSELVWIDRSGRVEELEDPWTGPMSDPALSPSGSRVAVSVIDASGTLHLWVRAVAGGTPVRLTFDGTRNRRPVWHPDGERVTFSSNFRGVEHAVMRYADGSGGPMQVAESFPFPEPATLFTGPMSGDWSADGRWFAFRFGEITGGSGLAFVDTAGTTGPQVYFDAPGAQTQPSLSPNGRYLAYLSNEQGPYELFVRPFPDPAGGLWLVHSEDVGSVMWSRDGSEIFFTSGGAMFSARVSTSPSFAVSVGELFRIPEDIVTTTGHRGFDVTADGQRFLFLREVPTGDGPVGPEPVVLARNWFAELSERVGGGR